MINYFLKWSTASAAVPPLRRTGSFMLTCHSGTFVTFNTARNPRLGGGCVGVPCNYPLSGPAGGADGGVWSPPGSPAGAGSGILVSFIIACWKLNRIS